MSAEAKFTYISDGKYKEGVLHLEDYARAENDHIRVSHLVNQRYRDADPRFGSAFHQGMQSLGIFTKSNPDYGIVPSTVKEVLTGECMRKQTALQATSGSSPSGGGTIVSPGGPVGGSTPASRVFFPEVVMQIMDEFLREDRSREMQILNSMLASDETIASEVFTQPLINTQAPQGARSMPIAQNAMPRNLVSITTSQTSKAITTNSVGLQISEQAQGHTTLDLVGIILSEQSEGEMRERLWEDLASIVSGNIDAGQAAMSVTAGTDLDAGMTAGVITQRGWMKLLWDPTRKLQIDSLIGTFDDMMAIYERTGRPLAFDPKTTGVNTGNLGTYGPNAEPTILNFEYYEPRMMVIPDGLWPAQHILAFDSRYFLRRVTNSSASYSATEKMVLQRSDFFRFDSGSMLYRLRDEAGMVIDYS